MGNFIKEHAKGSIENPNLGKAFVYFLLPLLLGLIVSVLIGISVDLGLWAINAITELLAWVASAVLLYIVIHLFKGKVASGKFKGILAGLAFRYVFVFFTLLLVFVILLIVIPEFFPLVSLAQSAETPEEAFNLIGNGIDSLNKESSALLFSGFALIMLGTVVGVILILYLVYQLIAFCGPTSKKLNFAILFSWIVIQAIIPLIFDIFI